MKKRWISLLLVFVMVLGMFPMAAFAADGEGASNVNPATGRERGPKGDEDVAVMVYGQSMADAVMKAGYSFDDFVTALKSELQGILANEKLPKVEMYLINSQNQEYELTLNAVDDAAFLSSFRMKSGGILGWLDDVFKWLQDGFGWLISGVDTIGEFYKIYGATDVPEGDYTLEVRRIDGDGYTLWEPESGQVRVHVGDDHVNYVGYEKHLGGHTFEFSFLWWDVEVYSIDFYMPGVFMKTEEPGFGFQSVDLGGNAVPGTEFVLVNREETEKILRAAFALGKDTFTNAMNLVGTEGFTWEELSILNSEILTWDDTAKQITFDHQATLKLLGTYWALLEASAMDPMITFMSDETDLRLPAILQATADKNGYVFFGEDSNVTLTWALDVLLKMGNVVLEEADDMELLDGVFQNKQTEALVNLVFTLAKAAAKQGTEFWDKNGDLVKGVINDWVYPLLTNDNIYSAAKSVLEWVLEDKLTPEQMKMLDLLPTHALLTKKMPAGHYLMLETAVPEGFIHSPLFYTMNLTWNTDSPAPKDWCYVTFGNLGLVLPYYAEDYYTWLRNFNYTAEADKVLNLITDGKSGTMVQDMISGKDDVTALTIAFTANLLYNNLGGDKVYGSELELANALTKHLYAYGRTSQNLMMFADKVIREGRAVVTGEITPEWKFYNFSTSLRTNIALKVKALLTETAKAIDTTGDNKITTAVKETTQKIADSIDTTNRIIEQTTAIQSKVQDVVKTTAKTVAKTALKTTLKVTKTLLGWWAESK